MISPCTHYTMGGVRIGPHGETGLEGLFAAGEVTGGIHGANRMGGNALSESLVFGARAGRSAADYRRAPQALRQKSHPSSEESWGQTPQSPRSTRATQPPARPSAPPRPCHSIVCSQYFSPTSIVSAFAASVR